MKTKNIRRHLIAIFAIAFTLHATNTQSCDCKSSSSGSTSSTPSPPPNPKVSVTNNYGVSIGYEIWTGSNLEYKEGTVYGDSLSRIVSLKTLANGSTDSDTATISYDGSFIIVVGVLDSTQYIYVTSLVVKNLQTDRSLSVTSGGSVN